VKKLKDLLKESYVWERKFGEKLPTLSDVQKKKINERSSTDKEYRKAKKLISQLRDIVKELEAHGEDYGIFQNAKKSAKILKKLKKDMYYIG